MGFVPSVDPYVFVSFQPLSIYYSNYTLVEATSQQLFLVVPDGLEPSQRAYETHVRTVRCHHILVSPRGFEPPTSAFQGQHSTKLSYGLISEIYYSVSSDLSKAKKMLVTIFFLHFPPESFHQIHIHKIWIYIPVFMIISFW